MSESLVEQADFGTIQVAELAAQLRVDSLRAAVGSASREVTSSLSAADLMAVLLARYLRYDWGNPGNPNNDRLILSKGLASPLLYSTFKAAGVIDDIELTTAYRRLGSRLQGPQTPESSLVDVATSSLGQGLPIGVGIAWIAKRLERLPYRVWVLCGDGELTQGSSWEALDKAGLNGLSNLTVIVDVNRLDRRGVTERGLDLDAYARRIEAFGVWAIQIDGHSLDEIDGAYDASRSGGRPTVILARTIEGKGVPEMENRDSRHGKALSPEVAERAVAALGGVRDPHVTRLLPENVVAGDEHRRRESPTVTLPTYVPGDAVATQTAYGDALQAIGVREDVLVADGEISDSAYAEGFAREHPDRYFEVYIAEQQLIAMAVAMSVRGYKPFASTFAAFFSRAYDFIRMAAVSRANIRLCGLHAGVTAGEVEAGDDEPSHVALEDIAALRAIVGSTVLCPSDATSTAALVGEMLERDGVVYLRTTRGKYPVLYGGDETFPIGGSKTLRASDADDVALIAAGATVHTCLAAAEELAVAGVRARVVDLYSVKPLDRQALVDASRVTGGRLVVVEDHRVQGGVGSAVVEALADQRQPPRTILLGVRGRSSSGIAGLVDEAGIGVPDVLAAVGSLLGLGPRLHP